MIDYSKFLQNSREWLCNYIKDNHLQSLIIGVERLRINFSSLFFDSKI